MRQERTDEKARGGIDVHQAMRREKRPGIGRLDDRPLRSLLGILRRTRARRSPYRTLRRRRQGQGHLGPNRLGDDRCAHLGDELVRLGRFFALREGAEEVGGELQEPRAQILILRADVDEPALNLCSDGANYATLRSATTFPAGFVLSFRAPFAFRLMTFDSSRSLGNCSANLRKPSRTIFARSA